jgi:argininosuccinate lyase
MKKDNEINRLWGKRFRREPSGLFQKFSSGRDVCCVSPADEKLIPFDIWGSRVHALMLAQGGIIPREVGKKLIYGLKELEKEWKEGRFRLDASKEDVHTNIESYLIEKLGIDIGGRLHTARSRNDQVALDIRLYLLDIAKKYIIGLLKVIKVLRDRGEKEKHVIMPGYTHHQPAQITTIGHTWLSFAECLLRDVSRFIDWFSRFNFNPLGSMTGYSTSFNIDRNLTAKLLGFKGPCENSLDPIQNRWEPEAELGFAITVMMNHLSSLCQTLILLGTGEFGVISLDEGFCSGSSMMPQKRNPDALEIIKGKAALVQGELVGLTSIGRSLFMGYNRDTQWTKYLIMDIIDESLPSLEIVAEILRTLKVNKERAEVLADKGFIGAAELVERLVAEKGIPFRRAKMAVERAVKYAEERGLEKISYGDLIRGIREENIKVLIDEKFVERNQDAKAAILRRRTIGGNAPLAVRRHIMHINRKIEKINNWLLEMMEKERNGRKKLEDLEKKL